MSVAETQLPAVCQPAASVCVCDSVHPRAGALCGGCRASQLGRNCYEMTVSPCCDLSRDSCGTCPVFGAVMREMSLTDRVRVMLEGGDYVEGEVYLQPNQRISDVLNDGDRSYITVANATLYHAPGAGSPPEQRDVILIAKRATTMIFPVAHAA